MEEGVDKDDSNNLPLTTYLFIVDPEPVPSIKLVEFSLL
jgi:hypothetical protein